MTYYTHIHLDVNRSTPFGKRMEESAYYCLYFDAEYDTVVKHSNRTFLKG